MLSRVAESIYWLNRYVERAENVARFVDVNLNLILDSPSGTAQQWEPLVVTTGDLPLFQERYGEATAENVIQFLTFDKDCPNSIFSCLEVARKNAGTIRQFISREMWQQVNAFYFMVKEADPGQSLSVLHDFFTEVKMASHLFAGVMDATMSHNEGWHFGKMGRLIERVDKTSRILDVKYFILLPREFAYIGEPQRESSPLRRETLLQGCLTANASSSFEDVGNTLDEIGWMALLKSASAYEMYRKRIQHRITSKGVAEFLILEREFPRSIQFCLLEAEKSLHQITGTPVGTWRNPAERSLGRLRSYLDYLTIEEIIQSGLHEFLDDLQRQINGVGDKIAETFFALEPRS